MKKHRIAIVVALLLAVGLFVAGCARQKDSDSKASEEAATEVAAVSEETDDAADVEEADDAADAEEAKESDEDEPVASSKKTRVYLAGPLFNQSEKDWNLRLAEMLEEHGYEVFLPQRDGIEAALLEGKTEEELTQMIFEKDEGEVLKADVLFMNLDGRAPDEGACVELGIAYASGKRCYGVKTDTRSVESNIDVNPMLTGCFTELFKDYDGDAVIEAIEEYLEENEL